MNRTSILRLALPIAFALGLAVACGPRMKPVEYEEPSKGLDGDSETVDEGSSSTSSSSSSSASSDKGESDSTPVPAAGGSCKDKRCGQSCSECPPGDESCMEILVLKQCNAKGECVPAKVECSSGDKDEKSKDGKSKDSKSKDTK